MIDWQAITQGYNDRYGTAYASTKTMIRNVYQRWGNIERAATDLGVPCRVFRDYMQQMQIDCRPRGGRRGDIPTLPYRISTGELLRRIHPRTLQCMTIGDIADDIGRPVTTTRRHMEKLGLKWKR